jgi:hypothetical protein
MTTMFPAQPLKRNRYFNGRMLGARDFTDEQEYVRERLRRHNRCLHGYGVVYGLGVTCDGSAVEVAAGMAIDGYGEEIVVPADVGLAAPPPGKVAFLVLRYAEGESDPVTIDDGTGTPMVEHTRIEEGYALDYEPRDPRRVPSPGPALGVPVARLTFARGRWRVDRTFRRRQVR